MATTIQTPTQWASALLGRLGIKQTTGAVQALVGWAKAEGGNWNNDAKFNPLNTNQSEPGAGNTGSQGNIKVYQSWDQGLDATVATLKNGRYGGIIQGLKSGDPNAVASAIGASPWGTSGSLVRSTISGTKVGALPQTPTYSTPSKSTGSYSTVTTPGVSNAPLRQQLIGQYLGAGGVKNSNATLAFAAGYRNAQDTPATTQTSYSTTPAKTLTPKVKGSGGTAALSWAESKVGFKETGVNSGGLASYLNGRFDMHNQPWCAMFTSAAVTKGGAPASARTASVAQVRAKALVGVGYEKGFIPPAQAKPGDLILFGDAHVGMVRSVKNGQINYVAGNQSNSVAEASVPFGGGDIVRPKYGQK